MDGSPPGSPVPRILQARTLEWVAICFSNAWKWKVKVKSLSRVQLVVTPWAAAYQAPPSLGFTRQEYWNGLPLPSLVIQLEAPLIVWVACLHGVESCLKHALQMPTWCSTGTRRLGTCFTCRLSRDHQCLCDSLQRGRGRGWRGRLWLKYQTAPGDSLHWRSFDLALLGGARLPVLSSLASEDTCCRVRLLAWWWLWWGAWPSARVSLCSGTRAWDALCCGSSSAETSTGLSRLELDSLGGNPGDDQVVAALPASWCPPPTWQSFGIQCVHFCWLSKLSTVLLRPVGGWNLRWAACCTAAMASVCGACPWASLCAHGGVSPGQSQLWNPALFCP